MPQFDFCVIGAGSAGFNAAVRAREMGKTVAIAEQRTELAGLCILRGCMPAKTVLRSAEVAKEVDDAAHFGIQAGRARVNPAAIVQRKRRVVREFADDRIKAIEEFPLFRGNPQFLSDASLAVAGEEITAEKFLIATGSRIYPLDIPGLRECGYLTSDDALEMAAFPKSLIVLGGGPVGCEFAQYFARLGVKVTLVQDAPELLVNEDPDVGAEVRKALQEEAVHIVLNARLHRAEHRNGTKTVTIAVNERTMELQAAEIFLAMNRRPNVDSLKLERAGVETDRRGVRTNEFLQTSNPAVYAAGDVLGRRMLVHLAEYCGRIAAGNAFSDTPCAIDFDLYEAHGVYTQPEVAVAGLAEWQCRERGIDFEVASYPFSEHGRAVTLDTPQGFIKMLAARNGSILGITIVGKDASDFVHEALALLYFGAKVYDVANMPHLHPTMAEIITWPAEELAKKLGLQDRLACGAR